MTIIVTKVVEGVHLGLFLHAIGIVDETGLRQYPEEIATTTMRGAGVVVLYRGEGRIAEMTATDVLTDTTVTKARSGTADRTGFQGTATQMKHHLMKGDGVTVVRGPSGITNTVRSEKGAKRRQATTNVLVGPLHPHPVASKIARLAKQMAVDLIQTIRPLRKVEQPA